MMGGRKRALTRLPLALPLSHPALSPLPWHYPDIKLSGLWGDRLVFQLPSLQQVKGIAWPLYNNKHGGPLPFLFISSRFLPLSTLFSRQNPKPAPAAPVEPNTLRIHSFSILSISDFMSCQRKTLNRNKTKEQKPPNEWACFMEEKVEVLKSLIRCSEKSFQLLEKKKKKKQNFFLKDVFQELPLWFF